MNEPHFDLLPRPRNERLERRLTRRAAVGAATALGISCLGRSEEAAGKKKGKKKRPAKLEIRFVRAWGGPGTGNGQFRPSGVAVASNGDVYVADFDNSRVQVFDAVGNYLDQWAVDNLMDVALSADREVFVASEGSNDRIDRFSAGGTFLGSIGGPGGGEGQFRGLISLAVAATGDVYAGDYHKDTIQHFGPTGNFIREWGGPGSLDGQLTDPTGIAVAPNGDVYVCELNNHRVSRFDAAGEFLGTWGSQGAGNGQFQNPRGIAVAPNGDVYVTDDLNNRIQVFSKTGAYLAQFGSAGSGDGQFDRPGDVALGPNGQIYVSDVFNDRIQQFELIKTKKKRKKKKRR